MSAPRKELTWSIKKSLYQLTCDEVYQLAMEVSRDFQEAVNFDSSDEEGCVEYILQYMKSNALLDTEDEGMSHLLALNDLVSNIIENRDLMVIRGSLTQGEENVTAASARTLAQADGNVTKPAPLPTVSIPRVTPPTNNTNSSIQDIEQLQAIHEELGKKLQSYKHGARQYDPQETSVPHLRNQVTAQGDTEKVVCLKDLPFLQRREFKVHGGQIGDQNSDITYNNICKQLDEGIKEGFTETEVIRGALRIVKPGAFRDMLTNKEEMALCELKGFLRSHLGEKASTELFQELVCAKQHEHEPPQQFLYRMIGLKQKILFQSKQGNSDICYDPKTIQGVFLHTVYQGLGSKHTDIRQQLRPLLSRSQVTDEEILSQVMKIIADENEHQRRLGYTSRQKPAHMHSVRVGDENHAMMEKDHQAIQKLSAQVEALTTMVAALMDQKTTKNHAASAQGLSSHTQCPSASRTAVSQNLLPPQRKEKPFCCMNCIQQGLEDCSHCFVCGEPGHRAIGCLKRTKKPLN